MQAEIEAEEIADQAAFGVDHFDLAVLIPCFNEATTIGKTVQAFRKAVPLARVYVFDNNSHDSTAEIAAGAGAIVRRRRCRERETSSAECSPTSMLTSTSSLTATALTTPTRPLAC